MSEHAQREQLAARSITYRRAPSSFGGPSRISHAFNFEHTYRILFHHGGEARLVQQLNRIESCVLMCLLTKELIRQTYCCELNEAWQRR